MRPLPPEILLEDYVGEDFFIPSPECDLWVRKTFLSDQSKLYNPDHEHLKMAHIGYLWTNVPNQSKMRPVAGEAEKPMFKGGAWQKHRQEMQMQEWFGHLPDFVITLDAQNAMESSDAGFCALVEHELYHCAQALDEFGQPKFKKDSNIPVFRIKDHDVTEFVGVVRRYGMDVSLNVRQLVEVAQNEPEIAEADIAAMCGNCR